MLLVFSYICVLHLCNAPHQISSDCRKPVPVILQLDIYRAGSVVLEVRLSGLLMDGASSRKRIGLIWRCFQVCWKQGKRGIKAQVHDVDEMFLYDFLHCSMASLTALST